MSIKDTNIWQRLEAHAETIRAQHLRDLLKDEERNKVMTADHDGIYLDYSRQNANLETLDLLFELADVAELKQKLRAIADGAKWNNTENRAVLHMALRAPKEKVMKLDGKNVVKDVHEVLDRIQAFSNSIRSGSWKGVTGKPLKNVVSIGIGGSYLGPEFVYEALRHDPAARAAAEGRRLRFLANVDPVDVARATEDLNPEETLVIVVSKTFTTAETMLNASTLKNWLLQGLKGQDPKAVVARHMAAVSTNLKLTSEFGIDSQNVFGFWDWVGGRYSVCSAVGVCPLSIQYGYDILRKFLDGAASIDEHLLSAPLRNNIPVVMGLVGVWNSSFLGHAARALLPYSQALLRFPAHIQQVDMESNGKRVDREGRELKFEAGEINFGEPGTNGQHSFYQLIHQGRVIPADFIGYAVSQEPIKLPGQAVSNHDELMSNFFAQPDALAYGKTMEELEKEGVPEELRPHKRLDAYSTGQLLALYEHRTAVQGLIWNINSFDQWGVELGKVLAKKVRGQLQQSRGTGGAETGSIQGFNSSTTALLQKYLAKY